MNKIVVPTGYMSSGSSAITDLISEMDGYDATYGSYEYVFLHCPNGVFDLEDKLLIGNNALRSDEALHSFLHTMRQLYDKTYWWVGHYQQYVGKEFWDCTLDYVKSLTQFTPSFYWYCQENCNFRMIIQLVIRRIVKLLTFGKIHLAKPLLYQPIFISYVTEEEFYQETKVNLEKIWELMEIKEKNIILDQLLLPFNVYRLDRYFDANIEVFIIDRDPRDMFLINKYYYPQRNETVPYPTDVDSFVQCYGRLHAMEKPTSSPRIHRLHFEDLIYNYDSSVALIRKALGVNESQHSQKGKKLVKEKSIRNTQLFLRNPEFAQEAQRIAAALPQYLYPFPYEYRYDGRTTF
jgi:hypothetical protein